MSMDHSGSSAICSDFQNCQYERSEFLVRVVNQRSAATTDAMLGFAEIDSASDRSSGVAYKPAAQEIAKRCRCDVYQVLGAVIAHEPGHLILGPNAHSAFGVMHPFLWSVTIRVDQDKRMGLYADQTRRLQGAVKKLLPSQTE